MAPLITIGILVVLWRFNLKWMTAPVIAFLLFYYLLLPRIVSRRLALFNRRAISLMTTGRAKELPALVKRSILLQLFGQRSAIDAKLGLAYVHMESYSLAVVCLDNAVSNAPPSERPALQTGLAKALLATSDLARAEAEGREVLDKFTRLPELLAIVARARVGLGKVDDETRRLLDEAEPLARTKDVQLMILLTKIEMALATGRKPEDLPADADSELKLMRAWINLVRGLLRQKRGDEDKAASSFKKARELLPSSFVSAIAEDCLRKMAPADKEEVEISKGKDPAVQRKRRRKH